ncbi:hypothetical protein BDL97_07G093200 [Sphagnum fallax]|nr:hypothetical protein BDL97_07G093200 [Sphagnum fallax]KAH8957442.1 hypothetical protein BDL97_07G093200 [Sphagnum fallax]KAH8957443.1 hypothetical protein BDL97_07G093200 [Sphagnum fallax]
MCVRDPIIRRKGQKAPARKSQVMKAEKEWNTDCYSNKSSSSSRKRQIMSLLKEQETTTRIEKDAADNKRMQLEMKKNAADSSSSSAMLIVTRDLMCADVVVEEQQIHIHQIQKNCCNNNEKEEERTDEDQSAVLLRDLMCGEVLQSPTEIYNGSTESLRFCTTMLPFDDYTKTRANSTSSRCSSILLSGQQQHQDEEGERLLDPVKNQVRENFEEAMGVLLEREGLIYYKLSTVYLQSLKASCKTAAAAATEDSSSCGSTESSLSSTRRRSVNWIFKEFTAGAVSEDEHHDSSTCSGIHGSISFSKGVPGGDGVRNAVGSNCMSMDCSQNAGQLPCPSLFSSGCGSYSKCGRAEDMGHGGSGAT